MKEADESKKPTAANLPASPRGAKHSALSPRDWGDRSWVMGIGLAFLSAAAYLFLSSMNDLVPSGYKMIIPSTVLVGTIWIVVALARKLYHRHGGGQMWECCVKYVFCFLCCCRCLSDWINEDHEHTDETVYESVDGEQPQQQQSARAPETPRSVTRTSEVSVTITPEPQTAKTSPPAPPPTARASNSSAAPPTPSVSRAQPDSSSSDSD